MSNATNSIKKGTNYTTYNPGSLTKWKDYDVEFPGLKIEGKHFLKEFLGFTGCEISIDSMAPGVGMPFYHKHTMNEEAYIFLKGNGQMQVDGEVIDVSEGSIVRIAPNGERTWRNNSNEPLIFIVIQMQENSLTQHTLDDGVVIEKEVSWPAE
jgi:mannose-6-phosphate isomerase-like protein (cupin superfamily)